MPSLQGLCQNGNSYKLAVTLSLANGVGLGEMQLSNEGSVQKTFRLSDEEGVGQSKDECCPEHF